MSRQTRIAVCLLFVAVVEVQGLTCSDVWNNQACVNGECYSCGARINYLVGTGKSEADAKYEVGVVEFPSVCGACVTCDDVWNKDACGAGGCYTCGARIDYLVSTGMERSAASRQVGVDEFPVPCGPCAPSCSDVWNNNACSSTGACYTCGARIEYLKGQGMSEAAARQQVGGVEFPKECGACATGKQPSPPTPPTPPTPPSPSVPTKSIVVRNECPYTVWPGMNGRKTDGSGAYFFGRRGSAQPAGFELKAGESRTIPVADGIASFTVWPRTGCAWGSDGKLRCETGECGNPLNNWDGTCFDSGPEGGVSLAEATIARNGGGAYYDLSLVDGYTLPIRMVTHHGSPQAGVPSAFNCGNPACRPDMTFSRCPPESRVLVNGRVVGCNNIHKVIHNAGSVARFPVLQSYLDNLDTRSKVECSCLVGSCAGQTTAELLAHLKNGNTLGADLTGYCCSPLNPLYSQPWEVSRHICRAEDKPKPLNGFGGGKRYDQIFKGMCPEAYSWQFDDEQSTYQCAGADLSLEVVFC